MPKDDNGKIRLIMVELEGNNETLQEGIRLFANAVTRPVAQRPPVPVTPPAGNGHSALPLPPGQTTLDILEEAYEEPASLPPTPPAKKGNSKRKYYSPKVLDIDLNTAEISFEEFCKQKSPSTTIDKYLVIAVWLKRYRNIEVLTADHIYTCYKKAGWGVQKDMAQPFRSGKSGGYMDSAGHGDYKINHIGEGKVDKMGGG